MQHAVRDNARLDTLLNKRDDSFEIPSKYHVKDFCLLNKTEAKEVTVAISSEERAADPIFTDE